MSGFIMDPNDLSLQKTTKQSTCEVITLDESESSSCESISDDTTNEQLTQQQTYIKILSPPSPLPSSSSTQKGKKTCSQSTKDRLRSSIAQISRSKVIKRKTKTKHRTVSSSQSKLESFEPKSTNTINQSTFDRLIEDNFVTISLQDELLALKSDMRQFEKNKFNELIRFTSLYNEKVQPRLTYPNRYALVDVQQHKEQWLKSLKRISAFQNIDIEDQIICIKQQFVDLSIVKSIIAIDPETRTLQRNGHKLSMAKCPLMTDPQFLPFLLSINRVFRSDPIVSALIVLIFLFDANTPNLKSSFSVRKEYILTIHLLQKYLELNGFTTEQANCEIGTFIGGLKHFLAFFNAKRKTLDCATTYIFNSAKLLSEILDIKQPNQLNEPNQPSIIVID